MKFPEGAIFLSFENAIEIHEDQINRHGGSPGIRDEGLLRSALAQAEAEFGGELLHPTLEAQAGAYLFHLVKNHPFIDGNKRVGAASCLVFLDQNGFGLVLSGLDRHSWRGNLSQKSETKIG